MSFLHGAVSFYIATILVFLGSDIIAAWGFDLQYGVSRVVNLSFIVCQAAGAYLEGVLSIGPAQSGLGETYILGASLPFPLPLLAAAVGGALVALFLGMVAAPRLRKEHFAIVTIVLAFGLASLVSGFTTLFNGDAGITGVPIPILNDSVPGAGALWVLVAITAGVALICYALMRNLYRAPISRTLRAVRDNERSAAAIGISPLSRKLVVMTVGGALGGASGALLVCAVGAWSTASWSVFEMLILLTAVVVGGPGNLIGVAAGVFLIPVLIGQGITFIPGMSTSGDLGANLQSILAGLLEIIFFWFRPSGLVPERVRTIMVPERAAATGQRPGLLALAGAEAGITAGVVDPAGGSDPLAFSSTKSPVSDGVSPPAAGGVPGGARREAEHGRRDQEAVPMLQVRDLVVAYGGLRAVDGCSFSLGPGISFLIGPNGAGKSTVLGCIAGAVPASSGKVFLTGQELSGPAYRRTRQGIARTFQVPQEFSSMTALENVMAAVPGQTGARLDGALFGGRRWLAQEQDVISEALSLLQTCGLERVANVRAGNLSGGQRKLLELARALALHPRLLLLDEPTAGVSLVVMNTFKDLLRLLRSRGTTMLVVAHEMSLVQELADDVIVMAEGKVLAQGPFDSVRSRDDVQYAYLGAGRR